MKLNYKFVNLVSIELEELAKQSAYPYSEKGYSRNSSLVKSA